MDEEYLKFLGKYNGGYFYNNALHLFGITTRLDYCDVGIANQLFKTNWGAFGKDIFVLGEDIFGNFIVKSAKGVELFFIESGEMEFVAPTFTTAMFKICEEPSYYTGYGFVSDRVVMESLGEGFRYGPKLPFILGGEYVHTNLVLKPWLDNLLFCSDIANQVKNVPDGAKFKIKIRT